MPTEIFKFGPFQSVYVGDAYTTLPNLPTVTGTFSTTALTKILAETTEGQNLRSGYATEWVPSKQKEMRIGNHRISFQVTFYDSDIQTGCIAQGNSLSSASLDAFSNEPNLFTLFLYDGNPLSEDSFLIPQCQPIVDTNYNRQKSAFTKTTVPFVFQTRTPISQKPFYRDTLANLQAISTFGARIVL